MNASIGPKGWMTADAGISLSQGNVTSFASVGPFLFAGLVQSTAYLSTNNGSSWKEAIGGPVGSNGTYIFGTYGSSIARSRDSGKTWEHLTQVPVINYAADGNCIFANSGVGIYRSRDSGANWLYNTTPSGLSLSAFDTLDTQMFAGGTGLFRSTDSGQNWEPFALATRTVHSLASSGTYLFAGTDSGVYVTFDKGVTWQNVSDNMAAQSGHYPSVTFLSVLDTMLFAVVDAGASLGVPSNGYVTARPISEMTQGTTASVVKAPTSDSIEIYPNPAMGTVTIQNGLPILSIAVTNLLGREVISIPKLNQTTVMLDLSKEPAGTYFISVQTSKGNSLHKIAKEN
ncbi:MAG TPA: T9SS type A sorting domain-containing protein [Candidatus Kapabacteria bacterium]